MTVESDLLAECLTSYGKGNFQAVVAIFETHRTDAPPAELRQIAAQSYLQLANADAATDSFVAAALQYADKQSINASICLANVYALLSRQRLSEAAEFVALSSLKLPTPCDAQINTIRSLAVSYANRGDWTLASATLVAASRYVSTRAFALSSLLELATKETHASSLTPDTSAIPRNAAATPKISIIVCSIDDARFEAFRAECAAAFFDEAYEIIRVNDARSMCEGYNRGMADASGDILIFCHDDIELLFTDGAARLSLALASADVICCVGSDECVGPSWIYSSVESMQGSMAMPMDDGRYVVSIVGVPDDQRPLRTCDGFFIACRAHVARELRWNDGTFTHFHMYDGDFCIRASNAGFRVQVARALPVSHRSPGAYDEHWQHEAKKFNQTHGIKTLHVNPPNPWVATYASDRVNAARCLAQLDHLMLPGWRNALAHRVAEISSRAVSQAPTLGALVGATKREFLLETP